MIVCPSCGEENPGHARFCLACAEPLTSSDPRGEERKIVSVLFVDLVGFTSRSDRADPEDVRATLRPYHERVKADIERFGGTVEKFIGDAVMAVFGAPVAHEDDAERAVRSALRILETIDELREGGLEIAVRAAATTGETVVALGARPERGEGIVTGDVVNVAARLQSAAPVGSVLVDETTMRSAEAAIVFVPLEPVEAKGKPEPIAVWRAVEPRSRVGQPEAAASTPFVGREHERTLLVESFLRTERESSAQLVTVVGEPGIGKSRLVTDLRTTLDDRPDVVTWRHGRCPSYGEGITFWALGEIVKAEAGILESDDQSAAASKLADTLAVLVHDESDRTWLSSSLGALVGAGEATAASRDETFTAWRRFLEEMAARRPCVLVVEDLHWADDALLDFLEHLLDWSTAVPLFLLCTARPELYERRPAWGGGKRNATTISLSPLSPEESGRLLQVLLDRTVLPAEMQSALLERAGGNPLYAEQFARMLAERGHVTDLAVPETVQALVAARLDTLRPDQKSLLHDAAVVGRVFWSGAAATVAGREQDDVRRDLNELVRREFVRPVRTSSIDGEDEFSFWHALVRDVAYQQIPRSPRAEKHVAAARWLAGASEGRAADHAEILVYHLGEAFDLSRAAGADTAEIIEPLVRYLLLAGERATHLDTTAAEGYFRRALGFLDGEGNGRARALAKLAAVLAQRGDYGGAIEAYEGALSVLRETDPAAASAALRGLASALWIRGDVEGCRARGFEAITLLEGEPGPELVTAYGAAALTEAISGRLDQAAGLAETGLKMAAALGVEDVMNLLMARASVLGYSGDPEAVAVSREARDLGLRLGLGRATAVAANNLAESLYYYETVGSGLAMWDEAIAFSRSRGIEEALRWQGGERLKALYHAGEWDELVDTGSGVLGWAESQGAGQLEILARLALCDVLVHRDGLDRAARHAEVLLPRARESGDPQVVVPGLTMAAVVASARGKAVAALGYVSQLEELTRDATAWRSFCLAWPARIARTCGAPELIEVLLDGIVPAPGWNACAIQSAAAALAEARGHERDAGALYRDAADRWSAWGSVVERAYALLGCARCGDADAAREADAIFARLGARPVLAQAA